MSVAQGAGSRTLFAKLVLPVPGGRSFFIPRQTHQISITTRSAARTATTTAAARARLRLVDLQRTAGEVRSVQRLHRTRCVGIRHLDETKTAGAASFAIGDQRQALYGAVGGEQ